MAEAEAALWQMMTERVWGSGEEVVIEERLVDQKCLLAFATGEPSRRCHGPRSQRFAGDAGPNTADGAMLLRC
jgi:hypothetical protein